MSFHKKILHHSQKIFAKAQQKIALFQAEKQKERKSFAFPSFKKKEKIAHTQHILVDISLLSALKIIGVIFGVLLAGKLFGELASIIFLFFISLFLSAAFFPGIAFLEKWKIPRPFAIIIIYILVIAVLIFLFSTLVPALLDQSIKLGEWIIQILSQISQGNFSALPETLQKHGPFLQEGLKNIDKSLQNLGASKETQAGILQFLQDNLSHIQKFGGNLTDIFFGIISSAITLVLILVLTFFILLDRENIQKFFVSLFSSHLQEYVAEKTSHVQEKITDWIHGQMMLFFLMASITWIGLSLLGVEYALTLAFLTGLAEFLPFLGPPMAFLFTAPIAFGNGGMETGLAVVAFFLFLQFLESNVFVPLVMNKAVGLPPVIVMLAMMIGFKLLYIWGAILAVPVATIVELFFVDLQRKENKKDVSKEK